MFVEQIQIENVRTFSKGRDIELIHPDRDWTSTRKGTSPEGLPKPRLKNVNLILGNNGAGKTTLLQCIAASAFGPAAKDLLDDGSMVRFGEEAGHINANLCLHAQDGADDEQIDADLELRRRGERLFVEVGAPQFERFWAPVYESQNDAFFVVGYGATRRVEYLERYDAGARSKSRASRDQRVMSLFEPSFSLIPLASWLPEVKKENPGRYKQVVAILNEVLKPGRISFTGERGTRRRPLYASSSDYMFRQGDVDVPFQCLSDGYRAFIGWVGDLLHHICFGCPSGKKLVESSGVVLLDEIDLHLHPAWQQKVIRSVARALPRMQFILTSHSPLVAGSLEWMNLILLTTRGREPKTTAKRIPESVHGLDADQILLTDFFGLKTTRAAAKDRELDRLRIAARGGDKDAAREFVRALAMGTESSDQGSLEADE